MLKTVLAPAFVIRQLQVAGGKESAPALGKQLADPVLCEPAAQALLAIRREMDRSLAPYRRKMSAEQLAQLERQYTQKRLFEYFEVPRLSLFYLT